MPGFSIEPAKITAASGCEVGIAMPASTDKTFKGIYEFGPFRVDPEKEILLRAGEPVPLTPKTFQILLVLVRHSKEVVTKDDLMKTVWPDTFVEEANLSRTSLCCERRWEKARRITGTSSQCQAVDTGLPRA